MCSAPAAVRLTVVALVAACLGAGCGGGGTATRPSGVDGTVTIGNLCLPAAQNGTCSDRPFVADVEIRDPSGRRAVTVRSDRTGRFRVRLPPGTYELVPLSARSNLPPGAATTTVTVVPGRYSRVNIRYDTGIS